MVIPSRCNFLLYETTGVIILELKNCECGKQVRLGALKIRVSGKYGVCHYIEHMDGSKMCKSGFECAAIKPYPKNEREKEYYKLIERWNESV